MKELKIGIFTHNFPVSEKDRQNAGVFVFDLARSLNRFAEVVVLAPGSDETVKMVAGLKIYSFKFIDKLGNLKVYNLSHLFKFGKFFISGNKALEKIIDENRDLDFVISMWAYPSGFFANRVFKTLGVPYAVYALGSDIYVYGKKPILKNLIKKYLLDAKFLVADSPDLAKEVEKISGKKTHFLPSASSIRLKTQKIKNKNPKIIFTFLGRLEKIKGIDIFMDALEDLDSAKLKVNIIGDGSLFNNIKEKSKNRPWIKLWGNISDFYKIAAILKNSDWLIIPSRSDSIPLVFSEAMKLSLPVIASDLPDLMYLIKKYRVGLLFKKENKSDLSKVLKKALIKNPDYLQFKKNTKEAAKIFNLGLTSAKLMDLIRVNI